MREKTTLFAERKLRNVDKVAVAYRVARGDKENAVAVWKGYDERSIRSALVSKIDNGSTRCKATRDFRQQDTKYTESNNESAQVFTRLPPLIT